MQPKSNSFLASSALALLLFGCASSPKPSFTASTLKNESRGAIHSQLVIISIDGLSPSFYTAPTLTKLIAMGASSDGAEAIYPSVTYPSHTSIVTGVRSSEHGIVSNTIFTNDEGPTSQWYWDSKAIKVPTLWQQSKAQGKTTAILTWPVSVNADVDWLIPEIFPGDASVKESTWELTRNRMKPEFLKELMKDNGGLVLDGFDRRDIWVARAAHYVLSTYHPDLTLVHIINLDHMEHDYGKNSPQALSALGVVDSQIAQIVEAIDFDKTTLIVLGDHGFYDYDKVININTLFREQGWLKLERDGKISPDWKVIAHVSGGTAAIYSRDPRLDRKIVNLLKRHEGLAYRWIGRSELDQRKAFPGAVCAVDPVLSVTGADGKPAPGYSMGKSATGHLIADQGRVLGNHGPLPTHPELYTGFIAVGPGITPGKKLGHISLLDVTPTAARILDISMPLGEGHALDFK